MDIIMILVFVMGFIMFVLLCGLILLYYLLYFRKRSVLHILTQDNKFINTTLKKIPSMEVRCKDGTEKGGIYFWRPQKSVKTQWGEHSYYYQGISEPIDFTHREMIPIPRLVAADFEKILKSDFITKLFHGQELEQVIMFLQIATLFLCIGIIVILFAKTTPKVECLAFNNSTRDFLRQALRG